MDSQCCHLLSLPLFSAQNSDTVPGGGIAILDYNMRTRAICKNDLAEGPGEPGFLMPYQSGATRFQVLTYVNI